MLTPHATPVSVIATTDLRRLYNQLDDQQDALAMQADLIAQLTAHRDEYRPEQQPPVERGHPRPGENSHRSRDDESAGREGDQGSCSETHGPRLLVDGEKV